jgi:hypothetical protein
MDKISEVLGTATGISEENSVEVVPAVSNEMAQVIEKYEDLQENLIEDYNFARNNLREIIRQAMLLLPNAVSLARDVESPRMYESASTFIKTIAEINKDLLEITERNLKKNSKAENSPSDQGQGNVVNNAIFVGTTEELCSKIANTRTEEPQK